MPDTFAIPNLSFLFREVEPETGNPSCRVCGRVITGNDGAKISHGRTHLADGSVEPVTFAEVDGTPTIVGYRTPGTVGFFAVWVDALGNERPALNSVGTNADRILADNLYYMGRTTMKRVHPIGYAPKGAAK